MLMQKFIACPRLFGVTCASIQGQNEQTSRNLITPQSFESTSTSNHLTISEINTIVSAG